MTPTDDPRAADAPPILRLRALVAALGFVALIALGPLAYLFTEPVKTRAARPAPEWSWEDFVAGRWTAALQDHLTGTSVVTTTIRGVWSETLELLGLHETQVVVGRGGALFAKFTLRPDLRRAQANAPHRQRFLRALAAWAERRGVRVFCVVVPDKIRVMAERVYPDGLLPEPKASAYAAILAELQDAGLATFDLAAAMQEWRAERPEEALYHERDTHWNDAGAWRTSRAIVEQLDARGWLDGIPRAPLESMPIQERTTRLDLSDLFGFLPDGLFAERLEDVQRHVNLRLARDGGVSVGLPQNQPDAKIALCGDSFSAWLAWGLTAASGRHVDFGGSVPAEGPLVGLLDTIARIERGELAPRVIVWEMVERSHARGHWDPPLEFPW